MATSSKSEVSVTQKAIQAAQEFEPWKRNTLIAGAGLGAAVGLLSALILVKNSERSGVRPTMSFREGFQLAVLAFGLIRGVGNLWQE